VWDRVVGGYEDIIGGGSGCEWILSGRSVVLRVGVGVEFGRVRCEWVWLLGWRKSYDVGWGEGMGVARVGSDMDGNR